MNIEITSSLKETINTILQLPHGFNFPITRNSFITNNDISEELLHDYIDTKSIFENSELVSSIIEEMLRQTYYVNHTPNGALLINNSLFEDLNKKGEFSCIHITSSLPHILEYGEIKLSSGCLPCTVYVTPYVDKVHNLTTSIITKELNTSNKYYSTILFRFHNFKRKPNIEMSGFDSQLLGELYHIIFESTKNLLSKEDIKLLEKHIYKQISSLNPLISLCHDYKKIKEINPEHFLDLFRGHIKQHGILGGLYFEAISEYIMLYQNDEESLELSKLGEINNRNHKTLIFELTAHLKKSFNVAHFYPTLLELVEFIQNHGFIKDLNITKFAELLKYRLSHMIRYKITRGDTTNKSIFGHLTYFFIKEKPHFRAYYQSFYLKKKEIIQKQRNDYNVIFPYRSDIPKGEIGINPSITDFEYEAHIVEVDKEQIFIKEKIPVTLTDSLVETSRKNMTTK